MKNAERGLCRDCGGIVYVKKLGSYRPACAPCTEAWRRFRAERGQGER